MTFILEIPIQNYPLSYCLNLIFEKKKNCVKKSKIKKYRKLKGRQIFSFFKWKVPHLWIELKNIFCMLMCIIENLKIFVLIQALNFIFILFLFIYFYFHYHLKIFSIFFLLIYLSGFCCNDCFKLDTQFINETKF